MRKYNFEEEKILILISSLMVWNNSGPKLKEVKEGGAMEGDEEGGEKPEGEEGEKGDEPDQ